MSREELLDRLHDQVSSLSDKDLEILVGALERNDSTVRAFLKAMAPQAPPEPCERRNCIPKFVVDEPGWKGCDGFRL